MQVVIVGLAGWRLASLLVHEDGPFGIFLRIRTAAGVPEGVDIIEGFWALLLSCVMCTSVWTCTAMYLAWYVHPLIPALIATWAVALVVDRTARH